MESLGTELLFHHDNNVLVHLVSCHTVIDMHVHVSHAYDGDCNVLVITDDDHEAN